MKQQELTDLHRRAMDYAEEAFFLERKKEIDGATKKYKDAFEVEKIVADHYLNSTEDFAKIEPTRSIVVLSAAALARDAGLMSERDYYANKVIKLNFDVYFVDEAKSLL